MTQTLEPFRYLEPQEGHHIKSLSYSASGDNILVVTGSCQPLLYDRDGFLVATSVKGDNYLMDATKTPGHQGNILDLSQSVLKEDKFSYDECRRVSPH